MSLAQATLSGTVSKDAEQRFTPNNSSVIAFSISILRYVGKTKEEKSYPVKVSLWSDNADLVSRLKKGARVIVSGRLQIDQFADVLSEWKMIDSAGYSLPQATPNQVELFETIKGSNNLKGQRYTGYVQWNFLKSKGIKNYIATATF
jgi:hypothetical protein